MKILFITHESSRTGAPLMLLYFMEWLSINRKNIEFDLLTLRPGEIDSQFKTLARNHFEFVKEDKRGLKRQLFDKLKEKFTKKTNNKQVVLNNINKNQYDVIYANSIASLSDAIDIKFGESKIIAHIHEMEINIALHAPSFKKIIPYVEHFIAASKSVERDLNKYSIIPKDHISVVYSFSKINEIRLNEAKKHSFIVGGSGLVGWRKGTDAFIQVANYINTYYKDYKVKFMWLGKISKQQKLEIELDLKKMNLTGIVDFVGQQNKPQEYYQNFDVFLLTSREDPFPLVCIEVGMLGKPILCFENTTGSADVLTNQEVVIIPYLDIRNMAEKIIYFYENPIEIIKIGDSNKEVFSNFTPELICPKLVDVLDKLTH